MIQAELIWISCYLLPFHLILAFHLIGLPSEWEGASISYHFQTTHNTLSDQITFELKQLQFCKKKKNESILIVIVHHILHFGNSYQPLTSNWVKTKPYRSNRFLMAAERLCFDPNGGKRLLIGGTNFTVLTDKKWIRWQIDRFCVIIVHSWCHISSCCWDEEWLWKRKLRLHTFILGL